MPLTPSVKSFMIADQVFRQEGTRKWCLIGVFNEIWAKRFPATHPSLGLFLRLADAQGEYRVKVELQDESGCTLANLQGLTLKVPNRLAEVEIGLQGSNLPLPHPGIYFLRVFFNDEQATSDIKLQVRKLEDKDV